MHSGGSLGFSPLHIILIIQGGSNNIMPVVRISELSAVNTMLSVIGEAPIESLNNALNSDVVSARNTLQTVSRSVQAEGWFFNTENNYPLIADNSGHITLPASVMSVDIEPNNMLDKSDVILRKDRLYNLEDHSYNFTPGAKYKATIIFLLDFDELPEIAKDYIVIRAARRFQTDSVGSDILEKFSEKDEYMARTALMREEIRDGDYNFLSHERNATVGYNRTQNVLANRRL
jgi:hypothetical protein